MNHHTEVDISDLADQWRIRARQFMREAERSRASAELVRLTATAATLEWAASDLEWVARSPKVPKPPGSDAPSGASVSEHQSTSADG
jgi:hypothetical protein